jgi:hypothetical protein
MMDLHWREFVLSTGVSTTQTADTSWDNVILRSTYDTDFYDSKFEVHPVSNGSWCYYCIQSRQK